MTGAERWRQIDDLFAEALEKPPEERAPFLAAAEALTLSTAWCRER